MSDIPTILIWAIGILFVGMVTTMVVLVIKDDLEDRK